MKAKHNISKKDRRLESSKVEPPELPVAQANDEDLHIDLEGFSGLSAVNDILEKLYRTPTPAATDCEDQSSAAHSRASALLSYVEYQELGLMAEGSGLVNPAAGAIVDAIQLQLDIMRLAGKRLYSLCRERPCSSQGSHHRAA
jgi:hypothetical protein